MTMAVNVREVTEIDRRTARRLGMSPEKVNEVISTWAEEYLKLERENSPAPPAPRKRAPRKAATKAAKKAIEDMSTRQVETEIAGDGQ